MRAEELLDLRSNLAKAKYQSLHVGCDDGRRKYTCMRQCVILPPMIAVDVNQLLNKLQYKSGSHYFGCQFFNHDIYVCIVGGTKGLHAHFYE